MNTDESTYADRLKMVWFLLWRGVTIGAGLGAVLGVVVGLVFAFTEYKAWGTPIAGAGGVFLGVFYTSPLIMRMMLRKHFAGFRVHIVRDSV